MAAEAEYQAAQAHHDGSPSACARYRAALAELEAAERAAQDGSRAGARPPPRWPMTAEAIARLRAEVDGTWTRSFVDTVDLRALLDAHAALEAAHTEALDALRVARRVMPWVVPETETVEAVLAKAGRRE